MRTTIDIEDRLLKEAWALVRPKSKRQLIELSLEEMIRREKLRRAAARIGHLSIDTTLEELKRMRRRG